MQTSLLAERRSSSLSFLSLSLTRYRRDNANLLTLLHSFIHLPRFLHIFIFLFFFSSLCLSLRIMSSTFIVRLSLLFPVFSIIYLIFKVHLIYYYYYYLFGWIKDIWVKIRLRFFFKRKNKGKWTRRSIRLERSITRCTRR